MSTQKAIQYGLMAAGGLLVMVGVALGFIPMHQGPVACGSLFNQANPYMLGGVVGQDACFAAYDTRKGIVWTLVILGALVVGGGFLWTMRGREQQWRRAAETRA